MSRNIRGALACLAAACLWLAPPQGVAPAYAAAVNYQGLWWRSPAGSESGWGINFTHQGDILFATWFTYDADGKPWWLIAVLNKTAGGSYSGEVSKVTGPPFDAVPFDSGQVAETVVGTMTATFTSATEGTLAYTVNGVAQAKPIVKQVFGPDPVCVWDGAIDAALATNYQDLWWRAPAGSESGWGVNFTHQGDVIFATWFTYDAAGKPWWLIATLDKTAGGAYAGAVATVTGPRFDSVPFDSTLVTETPVGTATVTFANGNSATFAYTVNGVSQTKAITRQVFVAPGTVCTAPLTAAEKRKDAARFLRQATFGAPVEAIDALVAQGYEAWLEEQFAKPAKSHLATLKADPALWDGAARAAMRSLWKQYFEGEDQLRQRVGYALSQIFVVSLKNNNVNAAYCGMGDWFDLLNRGAFGNARDLLRDVTLSPIMGEYLSMKGSAKADPVLQTQPDENYAREVMQLFSVGLLMLNDDGSVKLDVDGKPMPTYNEDTVKGFARALSGWTHAGQDQTKPTDWNGPQLDNSPANFLQSACPAWSTPMEPWATAFYSADNTRVIPGPAHDTGAKQLLVYPGAPYSTLPAGQSARTDLESVLDNLFIHPNAGPFLVKQLIQRLVTSNPSPQYVARVARKFDDNGSGVRGDMKAVVRAILLDEEARSLVVAAQPTYGKLSEPAVRFVQFNRAFNARTGSGVYELQSEFLTQPDRLNQAPMWAPSVFNFYHPNYVPAGPMTTARLVGPEFEITEAASISGFAGWVATVLIPGYRPQGPDAGERITPDYTYYRSLGGTPAQMLDALDLVLCANCLDPALKALMAQSLEKLPPDNEANPAPDRLATALWWILNSPDYLVQR